MSNMLILGVFIWTVKDIVGGIFLLLITLFICIFVPYWYIGDKIRQYKRHKIESSYDAYMEAHPQIENIVLSMKTEDEHDQDIKEALQKAGLMDRKGNLKSLACGRQILQVIKTTGHKALTYDYCTCAELNE